MLDWLIDFIYYAVIAAFCIAVGWFIFMVGTMFAAYVGVRGL